MIAKRRTIYKRRFMTARDTSARQVRTVAVARSQQSDRDKAGWMVIGALTAIILVVAINDVYWSFKTQEVLYESEQNPIGTWLIEMDGGDIALFMTAKMVGTMVVVMAIPLIYTIRRRIAQAVAGVLALFQSMLFLYLNFSDVFPIFAWL